jgi:hypothetical protein
MLVTTAIAECTVPEKILLAAIQLEKDGQSPFSAEALVVAAWQKYPRSFGLKGYYDLYPDSNKVLSSIMGEKGLARRGWLVKMGQKLYALTREGRQIVRRLLNEGDAPPDLETQVKLGRDQEKFLLGLYSSSALQKFEEHRKQDLTFADACRFWGVTENLRGEALDARLQHVENNLRELESLLEDGTAELSNGLSVSAGEMRVLKNMHNYMEDRFERHLNLLRSRSGRV